MTLRRLAIVCVALITLPLAAATRTWTGTSSGSWSDPANWGGSAVSANDDLVFPAGALNQTNTNDIAAGTSFHSIAITGGAYTLNGNAITLGAGGLSVSTSGNTINIPITLGASQTWTASGTADFTLAGNANLNGVTLILSIAGSSSTISGVISGVGAIAKTGAGPITFSGSNTYSGITAINQGYLIVSNPNSLGVEDGTAPNGTVVNSGSSLSLLNVVLGNEAVSVTGSGQSGNGALQLASCGNGTFTGPITASGNVQFSACGPGGSLSFNGPIGGTVTSLHLFGTSPFFFNAVNTLSGPIFIDPFASPNVVNVGITNAFSNVSIDVGFNETLKLNNFDDQIAAFSGVGKIDLGSGTLTVVGSNSSFNGVISGTGNVIAAGGGSQVFTFLGANNTATGTLGNSGSGALVFFGGTWPGPVLLTGGQTIFTNNAVIGPVTVNSGATVLFGSAGAPNTTSGNLIMSAGSNFEVFLISAASYSRLTLNGTANLGGASLIFETGAVYPVGTPFTIIDNDGSDAITGTFAGAPEGGTVTNPISGQRYAVTYQGGDGNDVVITAQLFSTTTTLMSSLNPSLTGQQVTFTATVTKSGGPGTPTGTVTFFDGSTPLATVPVNGSGVATFSTSSLGVGAHSITATYNGDANFATSTSAPVVQNVSTPVAIPTLDPRALLMLAIALAGGGAMLLRR